jgi:hypothetical protein
MIALYRIKVPLQDKDRLDIGGTAGSCKIRSGPVFKPDRLEN